MSHSSKHLASPALVLQASVARREAWIQNYLCVTSHPVFCIGVIFPPPPIPGLLTQRDILSILYSVFQLNEPEWTDDYHAAVASIGESDRVLYVQYAVV